MRASLHHPAVVKDNDLVGVLDSGKAMGNDDGSPLCTGSVESCLEGGLLNIATSSVLCTGQHNPSRMVLTTAVSLSLSRSLALSRGGRGDDNSSHTNLAFVVEGRGGFVQQQYFWLGHHGAGNGNPLPLSTA